MDYYVYLHVGKDGKPFYVGKGKGRRAWVSVGRNEEWHKLNLEGKRVIILYEGLTKEEAFSLEAFQIALWGRQDIGTGCLVNQSDGNEGGGGVKWTEERRRKVSRAIKASWDDPDVREARLTHLNKRNSDPQFKNFKREVLSRPEVRVKAGRTLSEYLKTEEGKKQRSEAMRKAYRNRKKPETTPLTNSPKGVTFNI